MTLEGFKRARELDSLINKAKEDINCYLIASESVTEEMRGRIDADDIMVCPWLKGDMCFVVSKTEWDNMLAHFELFVRKTDESL